MKKILSLVAMLGLCACVHSPSHELSADHVAAYDVREPTEAYRCEDAAAALVKSVEGLTMRKSNNANVVSKTWFAPGTYQEGVTKIEEFVVLSSSNFRYTVRMSAPRATRDCLLYSITR